LVSYDANGIRWQVWIAVSNAKCNKDLRGVFGGAGGRVGFGPSASGDVFWVPSDDGPVFGVGGTVGVGAGAGMWACPSYTFIHDF
jgi:hypothetical protein